MNKNEYKIIDIINLSVDFLTKKKIESPRLCVELIMSHFLNLSRLQLYISYDKPLYDNELDIIRAALKRAGNNEPIQYIIGKTQFFEFELEVNKNVLIPRPETEHLCEIIIKKWKDKSNIKILDIGTGSACIAIALSKKIVDSKVTAVDFSELALEIAKKNAISNNCEIEFIHLDILKQKPKGKFDIIVSNPPYVSKDEMTILPINVLKYEPKMALCDDSDGYGFYRRFAELFDELLEDNGFFYLELGYNQSNMINKIFKNKYKIEIEKDLSEIERFCIGQKVNKLLNN